MITRKFSLLAAGAAISLGLMTAPATLNAQNSQTAPSDDYPEIEDPQINAINRLPARTFTLPLASVKDAFTDELEPNTPYRKLLNGEWKISWTGDPANRIKDFYRTDFDDSCWETIDVPSCVELRGFGTPGYTNATYPHKPTPPVIRDYDFGTGDYDPVSSYRTTFTVPEGWDGRKIIIRFDGVYSAYHFWVNGQMAGYAEDSKLPSEFDITAFLNKGENQLAVEVFRWSDGSYLEDQDMFRFSGIYRDVTLYAVPQKSIEDFCISTELTNGYTDAKLSLKVTAPGAGKVSADLYDADFKKVGSFSNGSLTLKKAHLWSAEDPYLYTLVLRAGKDIRSKKVGIKQVEIKDEVILVNGSKVKFKGVNRHEHSAENGRSVSLEEMIADITLMKQFNINTVRTSHYPDHHLWYDLCDLYGIYIVAEANVEGHGMGYDEKGLGRFDEWKKSIVERNENQVLNYRNHPCVTIWSLGNETGHGQNFVDAYNAVKAIDPTRPVHWERGSQDVDMDSNMYPSVGWLKERASKPRAYFLCEYAHAMGNAIGNLKEYWDVFYSSDYLSGGCIWDWVDQALIKKTTRYDRDGKAITVFAYGGDYDESPNDGPFCCNGVIRPDRQVTAKIVEVGHVYQQLALSSEDASKGEAELWNRFSFTNSDKYDACWSLLEDGLEVEKGTWTVPSVAPGTRAAVKLPEVSYKTKAGKEYFLNVYFTLKNDEIWASKGHVVASDQLAWAAPKAKDGKGKSGVKAIVKEDDKIISVTNGSIRAEFCRRSGMLFSLVVDGKEILAANEGSAPRLSCLRAFVDNDVWMVNGWDGNGKIVNYGLTQLSYHCKGIKLSEGKDGSVTVETAIEVDGAKSAGFRHDMKWTFETDGTLTMTNSASPFGHMPSYLPRLGISLMLDGSLEQVEWYGRGPRENYVDRCSGSFIGRYNSTVTELYEEYVRPQDNGYRSDIRWFEFRDKAGKGVRFSGDIPFVQALHYDREDLEFARHRNGQVRNVNIKAPREEICLNLDYRQTGLGGASCGPAPLDENIVRPQQENWTIRISPLK
ncbi:MAG: DUF4981 domain-containing protein [Bacteroidales bacterium]|nr:DUF4981 domain-containing protein [Bacteroidales bacterium]